MRIMPALPFAEMNANAVSNGGTGSTNSLDDDQFGQVAYKLSLLSASGALTNGVDARDNVENNMPIGFGHLNGGQQHHQYGGAATGISMQQSSGPYDDHRNNAHTRRSANMTECVNVPSSEHVAEIVGRQGCKIKALRAKTNTYIKTPVRGEEPVFVVTGRREDVQAAKKEIEAAAEHFTQIRASRRGSSSGYNGSSNGGPPSPPGGPGQVTLRVPVPYRVVGLVVGPKGATIKRIQQQTHTYIVTPSRDRDPVFEITGTVPNVQAAKREIEQHIASRTGLQDTTNLPNHNQPQCSPGQQQQLHHQSLMPSVNGSADRFRQNGHHSEHQNGIHGRFSNGSVFDHRRNGQCLADEFHSNGSDAVFNNISGNINGVGGSGDVLGFQGNFLFGSNGSSSGQFHSSGSSSSQFSSSSGQFGFGAANGVSDSLASMSNGFGGAAGTDGSAFSFSPQDQYLNSFLQQNSQLLGGYEPQQNGLAMEDFKVNLDQPPALQNWNRPLSFGGDNAASTGLQHRRSSSYAGSGQCIACGCIDGHTGACSMDRSRGGDVRSAPATARFSPPGLVGDFVNGTATPPLNGTSSPPALMTNGFSPTNALDFDMSGAALSEQQQHSAVRRIRSDPLASGLQVGLSNLTAASSATTATLPFPSTVTTTAASTVSSGQQESAPSPPPLDLVGLSLSDELLGNGELSNGHEGAPKLGSEQRTGKCVRCQEHKDLTCLVPCGHMNFCKECADVLTNEAGEEKPACPTCDQPFSLGVIPRKG